METMTVILPETNDLQLCECGECKGTEFYAYVIPTKRDHVKIKRIECIICGDTTDFVPAPPEEFN